MAAWVACFVAVCVWQSVIRVRVFRCYRLGPTNGGCWIYYVILITVSQMTFPYLVEWNLSCCLEYSIVVLWNVLKIYGAYTSELVTEGVVAAHKGSRVLSVNRSCVYILCVLETKWLLVF